MLADGEPSLSEGVQSIAEWHDMLHRGLAADTKRLDSPGARPLASDELKPPPIARQEHGGIDQRLAVAAA